MMNKHSVNMYVYSLLLYNYVILLGDLLFNMAVHITYLISHSSSLSCYVVIKGIFGWVYNKYKNMLVC